GLTTKYMLKRALKKLLPSENIGRRKMGFGVPIGHWLRGELEPLLRETLTSQKALKRGLFQPEQIKRMVTWHADHKADYSSQLWTLLMLELWFQRFID
ncbi:MAG: asparagine synthase-related protein, partial [Pyrinomonadaceae bacterium]